MFATCLAVWILGLLAAKICFSLPLEHWANKHTPPHLAFYMNSGNWILVICLALSDFSSPRLTEALLAVLLDISLIHPAASVVGGEPGVKSFLGAHLMYSPVPMG